MTLGHYPMAHVTHALVLFHTLHYGLPHVRLSLKSLKHSPPLRPSRITQMCVACDAPDVLAEGLRCSNEAGLRLTYRGVCAGLRHWAEQLELHKVRPQ